MRTCVCVCVDVQNSIAVPRAIFSILWSHRRQPNGTGDYRRQATIQRRSFTEGRSNADDAEVILN